MRPTKYLPGPSLLLTTLGSLAFFSAPVLGQDDKTSDDKKSTPKATPVDNKSTPTPSPSPSAKSTPSATPKDSPTSESSTPSAKSTPSPTTDEKKSSSSKISISNTGSLVTSDPTGQPTITGGSQVTTGNELTGFPTLTGPGGIPTYPAPSVPPTKNAPFMQQSSMPDGSVFIIVGSILGAFGLAILLWRGIVSLLLHRSVERAAKAQHDANAKAGFPAPPAPFYKYTDQGSTMSLGGAGGAAAGRGVRRTNRGPIPSSTPSHSNLFFSPTAANNSGSGNRGSAFLPSGFYASNSPSAPPNQTNSISLNNLRPDSRGHYANVSRNTLGPSPPDSPQYAPRRDASGMSTSSVNLSALPPGQRAPSAYLEDLLGDDPNAFPPPQMPPSTGPRNSTGGGRTNSPLTRF
ncbi:hypothetical protein JDV02_005169 [Purpureocillium takamizusanense]|uniref:Uncharacterized protein n=1 Tax=Purpureocillium takamizusanense TaxID=2060973 RepID=A0A9Q8QGT0_9HYPO|nr:uncharacterized protein JDV02_005169 [Purpureocillium takamizusanense]UNI18941.1 hypothetical protein JDV02_005169 [Purpureocillium takamizusanense]